MSQPKREDFATENAFYWALSDYYESDEGLEELLQSFERAAAAGKLRIATGEEAKAAGRALLLQACGLEPNSEISDEQLMHIALHKDATAG